MLMARSGQLRCAAGKLRENVRRGSLVTKPSGSGTAAVERRVAAYGTAGSSPVAADRTPLMGS
jgi:hypothetical protein